MPLATGSLDSNTTAGEVERFFLLYCSFCKPHNKQVKKIQQTVSSISTSINRSLEHSIGRT